MNIRLYGVGIVVGLLAGTALSGREPPVPSEGKVVAGAEGLGVYRYEVTLLQEFGELDWQAPYPNVTRAWVDMGRPSSRHKLIPYSVSKDPKLLEFKLSEEMASPLVVQIETVDKSEQFADGRISLSALDAQIVGVDGAAAKAKLESQPGNHRITDWTNAGETIRWDYEATRPGMYDVELTCSFNPGPKSPLKPGAQSEIEITVGETPLVVKLAGKPYWKYVTVPFGKVHVTAAGKLPIVARCLRMMEPGVMNLKAVTLRPTSEGKPPIQDGDGSIVCHARDATLDSVLLQYEPKPEKNTLGYWVNERDAAHWDFDVSKPGRYEVEILQGCGKGEGGSDVQFSIAGQELKVTVEDTGHFQNFVPRVIGEVELKDGNQRLAVRALRKQAGAIMDLRQVRLSPK